MSISNLFADMARKQRENQLVYEAEEREYEFAAAYREWQDDEGTEQAAHAACDRLWEVLDALGTDQPI